MRINPTKLLKLISVTFAKGDIYGKSQPDDFDVDIQACSTMDCTGLIPALPETEAEQEADEDLYPYITRAKNIAEDK